MKVAFDVTLAGKSLEIEKRFTAICDEMNANPIHISQVNYAKELGKAQSTFSLLEAEARRMVNNSKFRPNASADCVAHFRANGANLSRKTPKGEPCMDKEVLQELARTYPEATVIIQAREALAILGQLRKWKEMADAGSVQPQWNQFGTPMGRMSCEGAALQNRVMEVRKTVVPSEGHIFLSCDISQLEYRMWASLSQDPVLIAAFNKEGRDFHQVMGDLVSQYLPKDADIRKSGKTINFALLYRMMARTLAGKLGIPLEDAEGIVNKYMAQASVAEAYAQRILKEFRRTGIISTVFGRSRDLKELVFSSDRKVEAEAIKTAWHHHNAGSAADLMKWMMCEVDDALIKADLKKYVKWVINMHDEFILEVQKGYENWVKQVVEENVRVPYPNWVPMVNSIVIAETWADLDS